LENIRAIIFDLDNTLLHSYWETAARETFKNFHITKDIDSNRIYDEFLKQDIRLCERFDAGEISLTELKKQRLHETTKAFNLVLTEQDYVDFQNVYEETGLTCISPNEQYIELLHQLSTRYKLAIMTNGSSEFQREKIKRLEIHTYIKSDYLFISAEVGFSKPSQQIYQRALRIMNVNAEEVLFVGDSWGNDVVGPILAGMKAVWVNKAGIAPLDEDVEFIEIKDVIELYDVLNLGKPG
jgi:HAD superfamily hydrolase (TIGR01549 family)